ncbi:unnamed protein product, partial [Dicrocoelium dendriticum]
MDYKLNHVLQIVLNKIYSHILITGDFYVHELEIEATNSMHFKTCLHEILSSYLTYNYVTSPTRIRTAYKPPIIYFVLTSEEPTVDGLIASIAMDRSDQMTLLFNYVCVMWNILRKWMIKCIGSRTTTCYPRLLSRYLGS